MITGGVKVENKGKEKLEVTAMSEILLDIASTTAVVFLKERVCGTRFIVSMPSLTLGCLGGGGIVPR